MRNLPLNLIRQALNEDGAWSDITTLSTVPGEQQARASIIARRAGVIAGLNVAAEAFRLLDDTIVIELLVQDGAAVQPGQILAHVSGPARSLLSAERVALNFLGRLSGIATVTARCVSAIEGTRARILDTRKGLYWRLIPHLTPILSSTLQELLFLGIEPNFRWKAFVQLFVDVARKQGAELVITLGALLADVPHTRDVRVVGTAAHELA